VIIAVDGPAAAGKSTLTRRLAETFDLARLETGLLYRAAAKLFLAENGDPENAAEAAAVARRIGEVDLDDPGLRDEAVGAMASRIAAIPEVRAELLNYQRSFAAHPPDGKKGAILDGRDIGTVVCPDAAYKFFLTASPAVRADRRVKELREKGLEVIYDRVLRDIIARDQQDRSRAVSPLVPADDALLLDTDELDADAVFAAAVNYIQPQNATVEGDR
jgi:cytidylate kinase